MSNEQPHSSFLFVKWLGMGHITHINSSCHTYQWVMPRIWMSHVTHMDVSCHTNWWVMSHIWMSHITHMNESCQPNQCGMPHIWMSHGTHVEGVMSRLQMKHSTHVTNCLMLSVAWLIHICDMTLWRVWLIHMCDMTHSYVRHTHLPHPPAPMNYVKYLRAGPAEMPFQNWYTTNTNDFRLTDSVRWKSRRQLGWVINIVLHNLVRRIRFGQ